MNSWRHLVELISVVGLGGVALLVPTTALAESLAQAPNATVVASSLIDLPDGAYQFCTEPAPQDWRDGAGACLTVVKTDVIASGYYGYPHSESFICLKGEISETSIVGTGMAISWEGDTWTDVPESSFYWDEEGRLFLSEGDWAKQKENMGWIVFKQAALNTQSLYRYDNVQMTPPEQLCNWQFELSENR